MKKFFYKAKDKNGKEVKGEVEATDSLGAAKLVRQRGYIVISISSSSFNLDSLLNRFKNHIGSGDVASFTRQLATMINAGLPITESLAILRLQAKPGFSPIVTQILADVEGGNSFSNSLKKYPSVFSNTYVALIRAGETGGVLEKVLTRLADNLEKSQEFKSKVKGALIYPAIIVNCNSCLISINLVCGYKLCLYP